MKTNKKILMIYIIILMLFLFVGIGYAYFTAIITDGDTGSSIVIQTAGSMNIDFQDGDTISLNDVLPGTSLTKIFTVNNMGSVEGTYNIGWKELYNEILYDELELNLSCTSYKKDNNSSIGSCGTTTIPVGTTNKDTIKNNISIEAGVYHKYTLTLKFKEIGSDQNYNQGKIMYRTIKIDADEIDYTTIRGVLTDSNSSILSNKLLTLHSDPISAVTNDKGEFILEGVKYGEHELIISNIDKTNSITDTISVVNSNIVNVDNKTINWNDNKKNIYKINVETTISTIDKITILYGNTTRDECFSFSAGTISDYYCYSGNENGLPTITDVVIPNKIDGIAVTTISQSAFSNNQLVSVEIPSSVTSIGSGAFFYNQLKSVEIPTSVTSIGQYAFSSNHLTSVEIASSVTTIGQYAFSSNQLTSVEIPSSVTSIGAGAFNDNNTDRYFYKRTGTKTNGIADIDYSTIISYGGGKKDIVIPDSVSGIMLISINSYAFEHNQLTSVGIPSSVTSIDAGAFQNNKLTSVEIPTSVTSIGSYAFSSNQLTSVEIPNSVTSIGAFAFYNNPLTSVIISATTNNLGNIVFYTAYLTNSNSETGINSLKTINVYSQDGTSITFPSNSFGTSTPTITYINGKSSPDDCFTYSLNGNEYTVTGYDTACGTNIIIPSYYNNKKVTGIGSNVFSSLQVVNIPNTITNIASNAFSSTLTNIYLNNYPSRTLTGEKWGGTNATINKFNCTLKTTGTYAGYFDSCAWN